ncbi:MAG: biliverdin-producing heme oxygenase [Phycisphaerales bacterium]
MNSHHPPTDPAAAPAPPAGKCPYTATKNAVARLFGFGGAAAPATDAGSPHTHPSATAHGEHAAHGSAAHGPAPATATPHAPPAGLHDALKTRTWPLHQQAEHHPFQAAIMRGSVPRRGYIAQLEQTLLVHQALEGHLAALRHSVPAIGAMVRDYHFRVPHARADLAVLGGNTFPVPLSPTQSLIAEINAAAMNRPHALVGYFYVLEGSTNGAKFIAKALARALNITDGQGLSYQDPHGDQQRSRWAEFKASLNTLGLSPAQEGEVVEAATSLFAWNVALFDLLAARFPITDAPAIEVPARHAQGAAPATA